MYIIHYPRTKDWGLVILVGKGSRAALERAALRTEEAQREHVGMEQYYK